MPIARINDHDMYYEVHGEGDPLVCAGGWGTFCHGEERHIPRGLTDRYSVIIFDHRGIGESDDDSSVDSSMRLYADDVVGLARHLGIDSFHMLGMVGMGACIGQEIAINYPERVRSLINTGCWAKVDSHFRGQLEMFTSLHREVGFYAFQLAVVLHSFAPEYFNEKKDLLLGPDGGWKDLRGRFGAHERFVNACLKHDTVDRLDRIAAPMLVVHAGRDMVTAPRLTLPIEKGVPGAEGVMMEDLAHVVAGKEQKIRFCNTLLDWLARH